MSDYEQTVTINRDPERVFSLARDVENVSKFFPMFRKIERQADERVRVEGEMMGYRFSQTGFFKIDETGRRIDFGSQGHPSLRGWLQVAQGPDVSASDLTAHLSFDLLPEQEERIRLQFANLDRMINDGLKMALNSFKNYCEGHGDSLDEADAAAPA